MKIEYLVVIKDNVEGFELIYESFEDVHEAIKLHKKIYTDKSLFKGILLSDFSELSEGIDEYYLNNPFKRYDIILEVDYE